MYCNKPAPKINTSSIYLMLFGHLYTTKLLKFDITHPIFPSALAWGHLAKQPDEDKNATCAWLISSAKKTSRVSCGN